MLAGGDRSSRRPVEDATAVFMTSVYLILLAVFVVLTSVSHLEPAKSEEVLASVTQAFGTGPSTIRGSSGPGRADEGVDRSAEHFRRLGHLVETTIALATVEHVEPGRVMEIHIPLNALFTAGGLRAEARLMLASMRQLLGSSSPTWRHQVELIESVRSGGPGSAAEIQRAGILARALLDAGAPPRSVTIGLDRGAPEHVRFVFRAVDAGHGRVTFSQDRR